MVLVPLEVQYVYIYIYMQLKGIKICEPQNDWHQDNFYLIYYLSTTLKEQLGVPLTVYPRYL